MLAVYDLCRKFEGLRLEPYLCPAGFWTIGYGHLCDADQPGITNAVAEQYLENDVQIALAQTLHWCPVLALKGDPWISTIVDFTFNMGVSRLRISTLRKRINEKQWNLVPYELNRWIFGGGRKLNGLIARRHAEILLWNSA